jgi:hypothetical protein
MTFKGEGVGKGKYVDKTAWGQQSQKCLLLAFAEKV